MWLSFNWFFLKANIVFYDQLWVSKWLLTTQPNSSSRQLCWNFWHVPMYPNYQVLLLYTYYVNSLQMKYIWIRDIWACIRPFKSFLWYLSAITVLPKLNVDHTQNFKKGLSLSRIEFIYVVHVIKRSSCSYCDGWLDCTTVWWYYFLC